MKDILTAPFLLEFTKMTTNMYRLGYNEGSGGNISYILYEDELKDYLDLNNVIREIPISFKADELIGKYFLVTATGSYFKNIETDPEYSLGIVRIKEDGTTAQLLWGFRCGKNFTSEFPTHLMAHIERLKIDPKHRVVLHCHPLATVAMTYIHPLNDRDFTRTLWKMNQECIVVFPDGVAALPWMLCGTNEIGMAPIPDEVPDGEHIILVTKEGEYVPTNSKFTLTDGEVSSISQIILKILPPSKLFNEATKVQYPVERIDNIKIFR